MKGTRIAIGALFLIAVLGLGAYGFRFASFALTPLHAIDTVVDIPKVRGPHDLTRLLVSQGALKAEDADSFVLLGRVGRYWKHVKAGEYQFTATMTPIDYFHVLTSGISISHPLTIREGENIYEIADALNQMHLLKRDAFLKTTSDPKLLAGLGFKSPLPKNLEGYLFPDTYFLNKTMTAEEIVRGMVHRFFALWGTEQDERAKALGLSRQEVITLASMIEKETGAPNERPIVSSVFYNRLKKKMRLQCDPTTIYGMWDRYTGKISKEDLLTESPYNTYTLPGLPAGPISNPGKASIDAALHPAESDFLYFVSHNDGTHEFSKDYGKHVNAVKKFQLDPKAREGKSWRDLSKKLKSQQQKSAG